MSKLESSIHQTRPLRRWGVTWNNTGTVISFMNIYVPLVGHSVQRNCDLDATTEAECCTLQEMFKLMSAQSKHPMCLLPGTRIGQGLDTAVPKRVC